jgi:hypothetical protein
MRHLILMRTLLALLVGLFVIHTVTAQTATAPNEGSRLTPGSMPGSYDFSWWGQPGRTYFIQHSEDMMAWEYVPLIESGVNGALSWTFNPTATKCFLRLQFSDIPTNDPFNDDFDGDKVSNLDEVTLGTNPLAAADTDTDGLPDDWERFYFGHTGADPNATAPGQGMTNLQHFELGSNPNNAPPPPTITPGTATLEQSAADLLYPADDSQLLLQNGNFSAPSLGSSNWQTYAGITGWTAISGSLIELQKFSNLAIAGQYCELDSHWPTSDRSGPSDHGIQQTVNLARGRYILFFDYRGRRAGADSLTAKVKSAGTSTEVVVATKTAASTTVWKRASTTFEVTGGNPNLATLPVTLSFDIPDAEAKDSYGAYIDNVILLPLDFLMSHPVVVGGNPPEYVTNADLAKVQLTVAAFPAADGTVVKWEIVEGTGSLSATESTTTDGFARTTLTTSTHAGDSYKVKARITKLILPPQGGNTPVELNLSASSYDSVSAIQQTTANIKVIPGFASSIVVERESVGGASAVSLEADGKSEMTLVATVRDQFGQPVAENTPVVWHLGGLGEIAPLAAATAADGKARAKLIAGNAVGQQKIHIEADGFATVETVENTAVTATVTSSANSLDIATGQSAVITANFPNAHDGAKVRWFTSRGEILNAESTVQSGQATAALRASGGRTGAVLITAAVGGTSTGTTVTFTSSAPISVEVDNPVIVGDAATAGTFDVQRLDGTMQAVAYQISTPVKIKAPAHAGQTATVQFGQMQPSVFARYRMDEITGGITPDTVSNYHATVTGATLDTAQKHEGAGALSFDGGSAFLSIADNANLRLQNGFKVSAWVKLSAGGGTIVGKNGEYRLFLDAQGRAAFSVTTATGVKTVTGPPMPLAQWVQVSGEYAADGTLALTVGGTKATAPAGGALVPGTSAIVAGQFAGRMDLLVFSVGQHFSAGTSLAVTGLNGGQVVLDGNGEATLNLASTGSGIVDDQNPVASVGVRVSINPVVELEDVVQVTTRKAYAVLDATMGDVKITVGNQAANLAGAQKSEVIARSLIEFQRTGQRSAALPFEPTGTIIDRQQYGFRAALWLEETVDGAQQVKVVLENVNRLNLTPEQEAQLQDQVTALLMDAVKGASDQGAQQHLAEAYGGLVATLADLSEQASFQAFTTVIDGRAIFVDMGELHEDFGPGVIFDLAAFAGKEAQNPTIVQEVMGIIKTFDDIATGQWQQTVFDTSEDFIRKTAEAALAAGKLTDGEVFAIGYGWGLYGEGFGALQAGNPQAASRLASQMAATVIAAINGSQAARDALQEAIPIWGLKKMNDATNALEAQGKHFDAGKKSAQLTVGAVGTAVAVGSMVKGGVSLIRAAKVLKPQKGGPPRVPASFGRAPRLDYRKTFFEGNPNLKPASDFIEVHHAVEQQVLTKPGYQNIATPSEINSIQNLRGIRKGRIDPATGREFHRSTIRDLWDDFYSKYDVELNRPPTKQELLEFATHIDDLYGQLFVPSVR